VHRVKERRELRRLVEPVFGAGQDGDVVHDRTRRQLPDDAQLLVPSVVLDAGQRHQMRRPAGEDVRVTA